LASSTQDPAPAVSGRRRSSSTERRSRPSLGSLPPPTVALLRQAGRIARGIGARAFLAGGPVRDLLLGRPVLDLDLAVDGDTRRFGNELARTLDGRVVYHARFLTGTVHRPDGGRVDFARTRTETYPKPAALPTVRPATVEADLVRRDFTINAMALEITPGRFGRLIDPHSGRADLDARLVRILQPASFRDDPTRVFRAIRFAVRLEFEIEPETLARMRDAVAARLPGLLTPERALHELQCFCAEEHAPRMFEAALREGLFPACFEHRPSPDFLGRFQRLNRRKCDPALLFIFVLAELPDNPRFPVTTEQRDAARAVRERRTLVAGLARARRPSTVCRRLRPVPEPALRIIAALASPPVHAGIRCYLDELAAVEPLLRGHDLAALGLRPGPAYRQILEALRDARLDGRVRTRADELSLVRRTLSRSKD